MRARLKFRVPGLCTLVMSVMVIGAFPSVTQAETGACWGYMSGGSLQCFSASLEAQPVVELEGQNWLLLIANVNLEISCTGLSFVEGGQLAANGTILLGRIEFSGCISSSKTPTLTKLGSCTPNDPIAGLGKIRTEKGKGLIVLHNGEPVLLLLPDTGLTLAKIFLGEECAVSEELIVGGELVLQDVGGKASFEEHKLAHLVREFTGLQLMHVGVNKATIDGTAVVRLASPHNALTWAGRGA